MGIFARATPPEAADPEGVRDRVEGITTLMRSRLGARGATLHELLHHSGRALPADVRTQAAYLADCADLAGHPRLIQRLDGARLLRAEETCRTHLESLGRWERRGATALAALRRLAVIGLATAALALALAIWRGLI